MPYVKLFKIKIAVFDRASEHLQKSNHKLVIIGFWLIVADW